VITLLIETNSSEFTKNVYPPIQKSRIATTTITKLLSIFFLDINPIYPSPRYIAETPNIFKIGIESLRGH
jgi:hypothetical protein